jgi:hypothetical protein
MLSSFLYCYIINSAGAQQIFHKNFSSFFIRKTSLGSKKKESFYEKFAGSQQYDPC